MILFSQQIEIISKVWSTFTGSPNFVRKQDLERYNLFLKASKYENSTVTNFKIVVMHVMINSSPKNKDELIIMLNKLNKTDIQEAMRLKSNIQARAYIVDNEMSKITTDQVPYREYKNKKISIFTTHEYYKTHPELVKGRIMKRDIDKLSKFESFFDT